MNISKIISPYTDPAVMQQALTTSAPEFAKGVFDLCLAFNLKADVHEKQAPLRNNVSLLTQEGWPAGRLTYNNDHDGSYFIYTSAFVNKAKASKRANRGARDAAKISSIISALKRYNEIPTLSLGINSERHGMDCAVRSIFSRVYESPSISLNGPATLAAVEFMLGKQTYSNPDAHRLEIETAYEGFLKRVGESKGASKTLERFSRGCKVIGIGRRMDDPYYMVGRATFDPVRESHRNFVFHGPLKRYATLADTDLAIDASIIRTFMQVKFRDENNELCVPRVDKYYDEIDITVGYSSHSFTWVFIPEQGE